MNHHIPTYLAQSVYDIDYNKLYANGKRVILFDLDNTIMIWKKDYIKALEKTVEKYNLNVEVKVITDETMSEITNCDGVIVVEKIDVSDLNKALDNLEVLKGFNVNLLGLALA